MSSRQLRKLQQQRELEQAQLRAQQEEEEEEEEEEVTPAAPTKASLFANLAALEDEDEDSEPEVEEKEPLNEDTSDPVPTTSAKKPKKSKKKNKKKKALKAKDESAKNSGADDFDEIDAALKELSLKQKSGGTSQEPIVKVDPEYQRVCALLGVNSQHLKVANEMRNLFGKGITDTVGSDEPQGGRGGRRRQQAEQIDLESALKGRHLKGKGLPELTLRRNTFIAGKDEWPKAALAGLSMAVVSDDTAEDGTIEFKYLYDNEYTATQLQFRQAVEMGDPQQMIALLQRHPYNISLLIIVSKIAKNQGDHALAADLLERALFTFGRAASSLFNTKMAQGKARLDFARPENRELWLAGYHYIKTLLMKGTYRTALEWAKFLLALDPEGDPYCMRLVIHNYAIRCNEFEFLSNVSSSQLVELWTEEPSVDSASSFSHTLPSLAYAAMQMKEGAKCREFLSASMQQTPWLFTRLFQEINLDSPPSIWGVVPRTDAETLFTEIYVTQMKDLWNTPAATALLMEVAHTIPKVDVKSIPPLGNEHMTLDIVRHIYLDDNPAIMKYAPNHLLHRDNNSDYDPLPPDHNILSDYSVDAQDFHGINHRQQDIPMMAPRAADIEAIQRALNEADAEGLPRDRGLVERLMNMIWPGVEEAVEGTIPGEGNEDLVEDDEESDGEGMPGLVDVDGRPARGARVEDGEESEEETDIMAP